MSFLCQQVELYKKIVFKQVSQKLPSSAIGQINSFPQEPQATGWANVTFFFRKTSIWMEGCIIRVRVRLCFLLTFRNRFFLMNQSKTFMKWYHTLSSLQLIKPWIFFLVMSDLKFNLGTTDIWCIWYFKKQNKKTLFGNIVSSVVRWKKISEHLFLSINNPYRVEQFGEKMACVLWKYFSVTIKWVFSNIFIFYFFGNKHIFDPLSMTIK